MDALSDDESDDEEAFEIQPTNRWGVLVSGLSLLARVNQSAAEMVEAGAKFWCELAMAAAGKSNDERRKLQFLRQASMEIETLAGGFDASASTTGRD